MSETEVETSEPSKVDNPGPVFSRRQVLAGMIGAGVVTVVGSSPVAGAMRALMLPGQQGNQVLVNIFLRGGADGLNIVAPYGDSDYYRLRPTLGQRRADLLDLDGFFGMHESFEPLHRFYQDGELAIVHAVGSNDPSRSHFTAMDNMDLAFGNTGWMQRALVVDSEVDPLAGLSIDDRTAPSLRGPNGGVAISRLRDFLGTAGALAHMRPTLEAMYGVAPDALTRDATMRSFTSIDRLANVSTATNVSYPRGGIARDLREAAALIKADVGVRMVSVNFGGWDHHSSELSRLQSKGAELSAALAAFKEDIGGQSGRVLTVIMSEFGRTAAENGSGGTDHGHGNMMMVLGGQVAAGGGGQVHLRNDRWVGLSPSDLNRDRYLAITTDFRSVLAELVENHLGIPDDGRIFPGHNPQFLGILPAVTTPPTTTIPTTTIPTTTVPTTTIPTTTVPTTTIPTTTVPPSTTQPPTTIGSDTGFITGRVSYVDGRPAAGVSIDLFEGVNGQRGSFLRSTTSGGQGEYQFTAPAGQNILTFIAPAGDSFTGGGGYHQPTVTVRPGETSSGVNARLVGGSVSDGSTLEGVVREADGRPVGAVTVDLFAALGDGSRGQFIGFTQTDQAGQYGFGIPAGCYVLTLIAPEDRTFVNGRKWHQPSVCVEQGETASGLDATLA